MKGCLVKLGIGAAVLFLLVLGTNFLKTPSRTQVVQNPQPSTQSERLMTLIETVGRGMAGECNSMDGYVLVYGERWDFSLESGSTYLRSPSGKSWRAPNEVKLMTTDTGDVAPLESTRNGMTLSFNCGF